VPATAGTFQLQPGSLTGGERVLIVGLVVLGPFPGASAGSGLLLSGFDAAPITVKVGTPLASGPGPVNLLAAGGQLLWSDGEAPVKAVPAGGGPVTRLVERHAMPESVRVVGTSLYWIAGEQLLRSARDGSGTTLVAQGPRNTGAIATATDVIVDGAAAYWVNIVLDATCSPACRWAITGAARRHRAHDAGHHAGRDQGTRRRRHHRLLGAAGVGAGQCRRERPGRQRRAGRAEGGRRRGDARERPPERAAARAPPWLHPR
jgi:hypothetical protein